MSALTAQEVEILVPFRVRLIKNQTVQYFLNLLRNKIIFFILDQRTTLTCNLDFLKPELVIFPKLILKVLFLNFSVLPIYEQHQKTSSTVFIVLQKEVQIFLPDYGNVLRLANVSYLDFLQTICRKRVLEILPCDA